jgi:hypothetical protein
MGGIEMNWTNDMSYIEATKRKKRKREKKK